LTQIESGELRALAVMAPERLAEFPEVPTCKELGVNWEAVGWRGLALPQGVPTEITTKVEAACMEIARSDEFKTFMKKNGFAPMVRGAEEFRKFLREQDEQWHKVIVGANIGATSIGDSKAKSHDPGPWALPTGVAIFVGASVAYQAARRKPRMEGESSPKNRTLAGAFLVFAIYAAVMPYVGFFVATTVVSVLAIRWLGKGWVSAVISTVVLMGAVYLLFVRLFRVPLPMGVLF
jgi:hypothetical protein